MYTVKEISRLTGVSVRTLHHYHAVGLLVPAQVSPAGYRLYDQENLERLQAILFFRELEFPLRDIKAILDAPGFDRRQALRDQIRLLEMRRDRLGMLIGLARDTLENGGKAMNFTAFDTKEIEAYAREAKERWSGTAAYREFAAKDGADFQRASGQLMDCFAKLGRLRDSAPGDQAVQEEVENIRRTISENFYTCTPEILRGLGEMYAADQRFRANIDRAGGEGTAEFAAKAIEFYCQNRKK